LFQLPKQTIKLKKQSNSSYAGTIPVLTTCGISQFIYFYLFEMVKALQIGKALAGKVGDGAALESFVGSLVAGILIYFVLDLFVPLFWTVLFL